jgi:thymidylate synthase (FAD)
MKIISPSFEILTPLDGQAVLKHIEMCGRVCYKSEDKITGTSAATFVASIIKRGHEAVLEHYDITVKFICDRGVSHELVRHRLASYCQESTRYCNYSKDGFGGEITVIWPYFLSKGSTAMQHWVWACRQAEDAYFNMLNFGCTPPGGPVRTAQQPQDGGGDDRQPAGMAAFLQAPHGSGSSPPDERGGHPAAPPDAGAHPRCV